MRLRGLVWLGVGLLITVGGALMDRPILLRFTQVPLGWVIMGIGVLYLGWDARKARQKPGSGARGEP